jgi:hypothetical protein
VWQARFVPARERNNKKNGKKNSRKGTEMLQV